ncbi:putative nucleotidyltransferase, ribonuclease H [Tanacetum coccineum]
MEDEFKPSVQPQRRVNSNIKEVVKKEVIKLLDSGLIYPIFDSPWVSPVQVVPKKRGMTVVKNEKNELIPQRTVTGWRMLERLAGHEYYCLLDGFLGYFHIPIAHQDQEKTTFGCPCGTFAYKQMPFVLCNAPATFQRCMTAIFYELIEDIMEVFMDNFFVFCSSFDHFLKNLEKMMKRCEETNLVLNWEKCHFMVKEGIVLGHKVSGFYRRFIKDFSQVACLMTQLLVKDTPFNFSKECIQAFDKLKRKLTHAPIMIKPDWSLPFEVMRDASDYVVGAVLGKRIDKYFKPIHYASKTMNEAQENYTTTKKELLEFDIEIRDKKGAKNLVAVHLSQLENPDLGKLTKAEIRDIFPEERLIAVYDKNNEPWYADYANYLASRCDDRIIRRCVVGDEVAQILRQCHRGPSGGHYGIATTARKVFEAGFYWPYIFRDTLRLVQVCDACQRADNISSRDETP